MERKTNGEKKKEKREKMDPGLPYSRWSLFDRAMGGETPLPDSVKLGTDLLGDDGCESQPSFPWRFSLVKSN